MENTVLYKDGKRIMKH